MKTWQSWFHTYGLLLEVGCWSRSSSPVCHASVCRTHGIILFVCAAPFPRCPRPAGVLLLVLVLASFGPKCACFHRRGWCWWSQLHRSPRPTGWLTYSTSLLGSWHHGIRECWGSEPLQPWISHAWCSWWFTTNLQPHRLFCVRGSLLLLLLLQQQPVSFVCDRSSNSAPSSPVATRLVH